MTQFLTFLLSLLLCSTFALSGPSFGIKAGINASYVSVETPVIVEDMSYQNRTGVIAGVFGELPLRVISNLSLRGDLLYVQKGTQYYFLGDNFEVAEDEITFAPYLVYNLNTLPSIQPFIEVGPELGINIQDKITANDSYSHDSNGSWKSANISLNIGGGLVAPIGNKSLTIEGRYNAGLTDMGTWIPDYLEGTRTWTKGIQVLIGYSFISLP